MLYTQNAIFVGKVISLIKILIFVKLVVHNVPHVLVKVHATLVDQEFSQAKMVTDGLVTVKMAIELDLMVSVVS